MRRRSSYHLAQLKRELHRRAQQETDEDKRHAYWRMFYKMDAEIRRLIEFLRTDGLPDHLWNDTFDTPQSHQPDDSTLDDNDFPPRQKGLWE